MRMSEMFEGYLTKKDITAEQLARALATTGPLKHKHMWYTGAVSAAGHEVKSQNTPIPQAKDSTEVDVPGGSYPGIDADLDAFRGKAVALKANASRILELIDQTLDAMAGGRTLAATLTTLGETAIHSDGQNITQLSCVIAAIESCCEAAAELAATVNQQGQSAAPPI